MATKADTGKGFDLNPEDLDAIRASWPAGLRKRKNDALIVKAEYLRNGWHNLLGACRKLTYERADAVDRKLSEGYSVADIGWAIRAYAAEIHKDPFRLRNPTARLSFEKFLQSDRFDLYLDQGEQLRTGKGKVSPIEREKAATLARLTTHWNTIPVGKQYDYLGRALDRLTRAGVPTDPPTVANPVVLKQALQIMAAMEGIK